MVVAPEFTADARELLAGKEALRLLELAPGIVAPPDHAVSSIAGGMLVQDSDVAVVSPTALEVVTERAPTEAELAGWLRSILANVLAHEVQRYRGARKRDVRKEVSLEQSLAQTSRLTGYLDGVNQNLSASWPAAAPSLAANITIGQTFQNSFQPSNGLIDDVRI